MAIFTVDIGGTKCATAVVELGAKQVSQVTHLVSWPTGAGGPVNTLPTIVEQFEKLTTSGISIDAIGVCFGGPVDSRAGIVYKSVHKDGWEAFNFIDWAKTTLGQPLAIDNDANVGALTEFIHEKNSECESLLYVTLSTGIGAGLVVAGSILHGANYSAGELGHVRVTDDPLECQCGRFGCFERVCSGAWLERTYGKSPNELLSQDDFLDQYATNLARGLANAILLYNPEILVLGGGITQAGHRLARALEVKLNQELGSWSHLVPKISISSFGPSGVHLGAMELARAVL